MPGKLKPAAWADRLRNLDDAWEGDTREFLGARRIEPSGYEHCLGTFGSGNHFAELQAMDRIANPEACEPFGITGDAVYLCVHSGSRGFGEATLREHVARFGSGGLAVRSEAASQYLARHNHAIRWASANRELIAARMLESPPSPLSRSERRAVNSTWPLQPPKLCISTARV